MGADDFRQMIAEPGRKVDVRQSFKVYVELYSQNSATGAGGASSLPAQKILSDEGTEMGFAATHAKAECGDFAMMENFKGFGHFKSSH